MLPLIRCSTARCVCTFICYIVLRIPVCEITTARYTDTKNHDHSFIECDSQNIPSITAWYARLAWQAYYVLHMLYFMNGSHYKSMCQTVCVVCFEDTPKYLHTYPKQRNHAHRTSKYSSRSIATLGSELKERPTYCKIRLFLGHETCKATLLFIVVCVLALVLCVWLL